MNVYILGLFRIWLSSSGHICRVILFYFSINRSSDYVLNSDLVDERILRVQTSLEFLFPL